MTQRIPQDFRERHAIPVFGHGVGLRRTHFDDVNAFAGRVDWLEIVSENFVSFGGEPRAILDKVSEQFPIVPHGVNLSVGGSEPLRRDYLGALKALCARIEAPFFSDHCCYTALGGAYFHDLLPMPFTEEAVHHVARRARQAAETVERPLALENITFYAVMPTSDMDEADFLCAVLEEADCGLLLDVNNIICNAHNHGYDPIQFLDRLPLERVVQVHMAGHRIEGDLRVDDHGSAIDPDGLALYSEVVRRIGPVSTLMEWDNDIPDVETLLQQADLSRRAEVSALDGAEVEEDGA